MKILFLFLLLLAPLVIRADQPRNRLSFTSPNGKFVFKIKTQTPGEKRWELIEKATKKVLYELDARLANFGSFTCLISEDGKNIAAIDDFSTENPEEDPKVLWFFVDGAPVKYYKLSDVFEDFQKVKTTASHFLWIKTPFPLVIFDSKLDFTTYELNRFVFDFKTGELLKKEKASPTKTN